MSAPRFATAWALVAAAALAGAAAAAPPPAGPAGFTTSGPLSLSFAGDGSAWYGALHTGLPLGRPPAADLAAAPALRLDGMLAATAAQGGSAPGLERLAWTTLLSRGAPGGGGWLGLSLAGAAPAGGPRTRFRLATGLWRALSPFEVEGAVIASNVLFRGDPRWARSVHWRVPEGADSTADTSRTEPADHAAEWTTGQATLRWRAGRLELETVAGLSLGEGAGPRRWAQATLRLQLTRRLLLDAAYGARPSPSLAFAAAAEPRSMVGVQLTPWPARGAGPPPAPELRTWKWQRWPGDRVLIRTQCRGAARVEVTGDLTDWQPVALAAYPGGWWAVALPAAPGLHRVQVRLDGGAWLPPPGLPRADDGPAGATGVMLVP